VYEFLIISEYGRVRHITELIIFNHMPSRQWDYFIENFFGDPYMMWHDGIDPHSVCLLEGAERDQAESMLIESMESGSHYAAKGLRELKSERAIPIMKRLLEKAGSDLKIQIAVALNIIEGTVKYTPHLIQVLRYNRSPYIRLSAAIELRRFPGEETIRALFDSVSTDPDYLVRNHASESLLSIHAFEPTISQYRDIFQLICTEFNPKDRASYDEATKQYTRAANMLRDLFKK
jgi:HEAT repeat protein